MNLTILIYCALLFSFTLLPLIRNDYWIFRVFDYPRLQKLFLNVTAIILVIAYYGGSPACKYTLLALLAINTFHLLWLILPFTWFGKKQVHKAGPRDTSKRINVMIANVFQDNKNTAGCLKEIGKADPDVVLLLETNGWWDTQTRALEKSYPYFKRVPLENTYGLLLYSKLELIGPAVKYLVENDIPSIHTQIKLRNGRLIQFYAVHPTPPVPNENVRSTERDKELLLVADLAKDSNMPVIVAGDLNDLFYRISSLINTNPGNF
jgi:endonuclease/exonuclease/phosphatase (EEP) superfamily protein YafD